MVHRAPFYRIGNILKHCQEPKDDNLCIYVFQASDRFYHCILCVGCYLADTAICNALVALCQ